MKEIIITNNEAGQRFDKYIMKYLNKAPSSFTYKMLRKKNITLNGKKAEGSEKLNPGDVVKLFLSDETIEKFSKPIQSVSLRKNISRQYDIRNDIIYEDDNVLFINKKAGILSQKAGHDDVSINEYMIDYLIKSKALNENDLRTFKPSICNRLDRNTSGLITCGKSLMGLQELSRLFKERGVDKYYITIVAGKLAQKAKIKGYLIKDETGNKVEIFETEPPVKSEYIETEYEPLYYGRTENYDYTVLKVKLITGKTHQIRAHLSSINHPCLGDLKYGQTDYNKFFKEAFGVKYQLLHSYELKFITVTGGLSYLNGNTFTAQLPKIYERLWKQN